MGRGTRWLIDPLGRLSQTNKPKKAAASAKDGDEFEAMIASMDKENAVASPAKKSKKKTVEETYQKLTQLEHVLLRPDTYIGSTEMNRTKVSALTCPASTSIHFPRGACPMSFKFCNHI